MRSLVGILIAVSVSALGCESRFPVCKVDEDCKKTASSADTSAKALVCYDLRCVECRYDSDCGDGRACDRKTGTCESIGGPMPKYGEPVPDPTTETPAPAPTTSASAAPAAKP